MLESAMRPGAFVIIALAGGFLIWNLLTVPRPLRWHRTQSEIKPPPSTDDPTDSAPWLILLPHRWMRWGIKNMQWATGGSVVVATFVITGNPFSTAAFGWIGFLLPDIILRDIAWARWTALDQAAYSLVYSARFYLEQGMPMLQTWRSLVPDAPEGFQEWITPCLLGESEGWPFEILLKQQALAIRHMELAVTADILSAERRHGGAVQSLAQALTLWGKRIELDADRRGTLTGFVWISRLTLGGGMLLFWGMILGDAAIRSAMHSFSGDVVTGISAGLLALGVWLYQRQSRAAERF